MKNLRHIQTSFVFCLAVLCFTPLAVHARPKTNPRSAPPLCVSFIDQIPPQGGRPAFNGLDERRRGLIFKAALQEVVREGGLPRAVFINKDLSLPSTRFNEPKTPAGATLARIYLTQWSQTGLGGIADTEILCRFYVETVRDGRATKKLGPFFARKTYNVVAVTRPEDRWAQYQAAARGAIEEMAAALGKQARG